MKRTSLFLCAASAALGITLALAQPAAAAADLKAGTLTCNVSSGWGFIFGSSKDLRCVFQPVDGHVEHYRGTIGKFGVDIGYTAAGVVVWGVFAPSSTVNPGALAGEYVGATAQVTAGLGVGANALIGGFNKSIALQPLSIEGSTGLNVAAGIGAIRLRHEP